MRSGFAVVLAAAIAATMVSPTFAAVCMEKSLTRDEIVTTIGAANGCARAMAVFKECQFGTSGDIALGAAVEKKCEASFWSRLTAARKKAYRREMDRCDRKYANEAGTMSRSFTAYCRAEIARRYAHRR